MLRAVLAVALAAGLLAACVPAMDDASVEVANERVAGELARLTDAARALRRREPALPSGMPGARQVVTLAFPEPGPGTAGVRNVTIRSDAAGEGPGRGRYAWSVHGGARRTRRVSGPPLLVDGAGPSAAIVLRGAGPHRLALAPVRTSDGAAIQVRRAEV